MSRCQIDNRPVTSRVYNVGAGVTPEERFWSRVEKKGQDDCWEWQGSKNQLGYGKVDFQRKRYKAHRFAWFLTTGHHPQGWLLHDCDNPSCVNPNHLREGTHKENMADMVDRRRHWTHNRTHCKNNHDLRLPQATRVIRHKQRDERICVQCDRDRKRRWEMKQKGSIPTRPLV